MLRVSALEKRFGGLAALNDVSFSVAPGQIKSVIGPNGAGKTTLFNLIAGTLSPSAGDIHLDGVSIAGLPAAAIGAAGVARTFQQPRVFASLSILENAMLGGHRFHKGGFLACGLGLRHTRREEEKLRARAEKWLDFAGIQSIKHRNASELPLGQQRYVEIARAMATGAKLILMDEPAAGLDETETKELGEMVRAIRGTGTTVLIIDHHMDFIMSLADEVLVLNFGQWLAEGTPSQIQNSEIVIEAYLGSDDDA
ncbi:ABC transporter ATP-binding protein [Hoeflea alexandrii]|uniref:ABC transporter ATP-binding protein n=1 Tax=Hoeflea alexandrii TaxID=288436 RepID=UPI0022AEF188|nr:ABC transporter ATP-binding protein [Hoeflea alexandrii]MCZ4291660.1 ABC transporter ATP-binding protein [Hoeflea alexandrii]